MTPSTELEACTATMVGERLWFWRFFTVMLVSKVGEPQYRPQIL